MLTEVTKFNKWLRRKSPHTSTHLHYTNDLRLFFSWAKKKPAEIRVSDIDAYIEFCQRQRHSIATINRPLAALRAFYHFLDFELEPAPANPVLPKRHFIRRGQQLPRDVQDSDLEQLFTFITPLATGRCSS
jgi:site-specific recombinase XerD